MKRNLFTTSLAVLAIGLTAACGSGGDSGKAESSTGPIKVWLSNNPEEIAWGKSMVKEWNAQHSDQKVSAQEIPAGKTSEEVIGAAITAGNAPCLVFNKGAYFFFRIRINSIRFGLLQQIMHREWS